MLPKSEPKPEPYTHLRGFLEKLAVGDLNSYVTYLTEEEEQYLYDLMMDLHASRAVDLRGVWSLLSLCFEKRSGAWLMAMYYSSSIVKDSFTKKKFNDDIKFLVSPDKIDIKTIFKILPIIKIEKQYFQEKYREWLSSEYLPTLDAHLAPALKQLPGDPIFADGEYESDPDTVFYQDLADAFSESQMKTIRHNMTLQHNCKIEELSESEPVQNQEEENTISLGIKRKAYRDPHSIPKQRKKRARRPRRRRQVREALEKNFWSVSRKKQTFFRTKKQKDRLRRKKQYEQYVQIFQEEETPKKPTRSRRRGKPTAVHFQDNHLISSLNFESDSDHEMDVEDESSEASQQESVPQLKNRRLFKNKSNYIADDQQILVFEKVGFEESLSQICIRQIPFPARLPRKETDSIFGFTEYQWEVEGMNTKDVLKEIKDLVHHSKLRIKPSVFSHDQRTCNLNEQIEIIMRTITLVSCLPDGGFKAGYVEPLIGFNIKRLICRLLADIIQLLYTPTSDDMANINYYCSIFNQLANYRVKPREDSLSQELSRIDARVYEAFACILAQFAATPSETDSLIAFSSSPVMLKQFLKVKLKEKEYVETVLVAVVMAVGWTRRTFEDQQGSSLLDERIRQCFKEGVKEKARFIQMLIKIYHIQGVSITKGIKESVETLACELDLSADQPVELFYSFEQLYHDFITHSFHQNPNANFKHILNYLTVKGFMSECRKFYNQSNSNYARIVLTTFSSMLERPVFHHDITLRSLIAELVKINLFGNIDETLMQDLMKLILDAYRIKLREKQDKCKQFTAEGMGDDEVLVKVEGLLEKCFEVMCEKYRIFLDQKVEAAVSKTDKFRRLLQRYFQLFINNREFSYSLHHYFLTVRLLLNIFVPLLTRGCKCIDAELLTEVISKFSQYPSIEELVKPQKLQGEASSTMDIEDDEEGFQLLLQFSQNKKDLSKKFTRFLESLNFGERFESRNVLAISSMMHPLEKTSYELEGILACLTLFHNKNSIAVKSIVFDAIRSEHLGGVAIVKNSSGSLFQTNELVLEFLKGFLSMMIYLKESKIDQSFDVRGSIRPAILDIIFVSLYTKTAKSMIQEQLTHLLGFRQVQHFLSKSLAAQVASPPRNGYLELNNIEETLHSLPRTQVEMSINSKFKMYLNVWVKLNQSYVERQWNTKKTDLSLMFVQVFTLLLNFGAQTSLIQEYKSYIIIRDPYNNSNSYNFLKTVDVRSHIPNAACSVINLLRTIHTKDLNSLKDTRDNYLEYIVNLDIKNLEASAFTYTRGLLQALGTIRDAFTTALFLDLNRRLLNYILMKEYQSRVLKEFMQRFKNFGAYSRELMTIFGEREKQIEGIVKTQAWDGCQSLEQAIVKYIIQSPNCDFQAFALILEERVRKNIRFGFMNDRRLLQQQQHLISVSLEILHRREQAGPLITRYEALLREIEQSLSYERPGGMETQMIGQIGY